MGAEESGTAGARVGCPREKRGKKKMRSERWLARAG